MIFLTIPYIGTLNEYQIFSIHQLAKIKRINVNLIIENKKNNLENLKLERVNIYDIDDVFNEDNSFELSLNELKSNPYKLCDFKPFFNLIFEISYPSNGYIGWADLDCIYNPTALNETLKNITDQNTVYGQNGHLTICGAKAYYKVQSYFLKINDLYFSKSINIFSYKRHFALDEYLFLHVILDFLDRDGYIRWDRKAFYPIFDVDYKHLIPNNYNGQVIKFDISSVYYDDVLSDVNYIHLQKRKITGSTSCVINGESMYMSFNHNSGVVEIDQFETVQKRPNALDQINFFIKALSKRVITRYRNHGFNPRPKIQSEMVKKLK